MFDIHKPSAGSPSRDVKQFYNPVELAIIYDWFGLSRPTELNNIEIYSDPNQEHSEQQPGEIYVVPDRHGDDSLGISNAVARLVLSGIQDRLPQWALVGEGGDVHFARDYNEKRSSQIVLLPRFLFEINWADSGPGFSWPESYHATWLPGFGGYVVTASQDSPDMWGYTDEAIGFSPREKDFMEGCGEIITGWWRGQLEGHWQQRWEGLFATGEVDGEMASTWADEVWREDDEAAGI